MSKTEMCLKMLECLSSGNRWHVDELAEALETNPRNIIEYKRELEECGYEIDNISGRYGGYQLLDSCRIPVLKLTNEEKDVLRECYSYLVSKELFVNKTVFERAMGKIFASIENKSTTSPVLVVEKDKTIRDSIKIQEIYNIVKDCTDNNFAFTMEYINTKEKVVKKTIRPYYMYIYNENWFVHGECVETGMFSFYKLTRIQSIKSTNKEFQRDPYYKVSEYIDESGFKKNDEWYDIKLEVSGYSLFRIKEKSLGKNQKIEMISKDKGILSVSMQYKPNIIGFVMGLGSFCKVIEPQWLVDQVLKITDEMQKMYVALENKA